MPVVTVVTDIFIKTSSDSSVSSGLIESRYRNFDLIYCSETGDNKDCSDSINSNGSNDIIDTRERSRRSDCSKHSSTNNVVAESLMNSY